MDMIDIAYIESIPAHNPVYQKQIYMDTILNIEKAVEHANKNSRNRICETIFKKAAAIDYNCMSSTEFLEFCDSIKESL